jgi:sarcosine oxidase
VARYDVIVVGLGAIGSAAACHVASRGLRVLGLDARAPPHTFGSHHGESRIIRMAYYEHPSYVPLLRRAFASWSELQERCGRRLMLRTGGLMVGLPGSELVSGVLASVRAHGLAHEVLDCDAIVTRYPALHVDRDMIAVRDDDAGILFPEACIRAFLDAAVSAGAELRLEEPVAAWKAGANGVEVATAKATYRARTLVLAPGTGMRDLLPELQQHLTIERQVVAHFEPTRAAPVTPERLPIYCVEEPDGAFYYGIPDLGAGCKVGRHHAGLTGEPEDAWRSVTSADVDDLRAFLVRRLPSVDGPVTSSASCLYTNTPDWHFVLDRHPRHPGVIVASVCSGHGFKFASVVGEVVADWAAGSQPPFDLSMFGMPRLIRRRPRPRA